AVQARRVGRVDVAAQDGAGFVAGVGRDDGGVAGGGDQRFQSPCHEVNEAARGEAEGQERNRKPAETDDRNRRWPAGPGWLRRSDRILENLPGVVFGRDFRLPIVEESLHRPPSAAAVRTGRW